MRIPIFDATEDAYWWVLCTEKYFKLWSTPETLKMTVVGLAMKGSALTWWLRWYPRHPLVKWDAFNAIFLWQFKPEWRVILPLPDDEEEIEFESQQLAQGVIGVEQSTTVEERIDDFNQYSSSMEVADLEIADLTLIGNNLNNSTLDDVQHVEENHVDDEFGHCHHKNLLINPTSEGIGEIPILPITATKTSLTEPTGDVIDKDTTTDQGLLLKPIFSVALDFVTLEQSQARMRNSTFRMNLNPFLDEIKVVPMSVYANLDVDITGIQHDSRFVPPDKLYNCDIENTKTNSITTTNCLTKGLYMIPHYRVDFCCFNIDCVTHNSTTKNPHCKFSPLAANTVSFAMSKTKPPVGGFFKMGCKMASPREEFVGQCCSLIHLMTTSPLWLKAEVVMNLASLRWFYNLHVPPIPLDRLILKLDFRPPAKPPDPYLHTEGDEFMVLHNQLFLLVFIIESRLQVTKLICNVLQQDLFLQQLGCTQPNNVKAKCSTTQVTVQVIQLVAIFAVTGTFITIPCLLKFTSGMNLKYKKGFLNPLLTYDVGSYMFVQNLFTYVFSWCGCVRVVYKQFAISEACELKWLLIEIERNNFSSILKNSACSKLKELDDSIHIGRYITVGFVVPNFIGKNTLIARVAACGGINTGDNVFHNMQIKD